MHAAILMAASSLIIFSETEAGENPMAEPDAQRRGGRGAGDEKLLTLSQVAQKTGISMPTLQRYKKLYQGRIPSVGAGRKQRYPETALPVFEEIKNENIGRRGRPRKDASQAAGRGAGGRRAAGGRRGRRPAAGGAAGARRGRGQAQGASGNLLTLTQISKDTGISYPTLVRYVRLHLNRLPHEGKGRARRFHPESVEVFRQLRQASGRGGRKPGSGAGRGRGRGARAEESGLGHRLRALERSQAELEKRFKGFVQSLQRLFR
jgi:DNA-binding transcriptional MerR regulator